MSVENYGNLYFSDEKIRITILTNICRMMVTRGYMDIKKYKSTGKSSNTKNIAEHPSNDHIDNDLFLPFIQTASDDNIYRIPLDTPYKDQRSKKTEIVSGKSEKNMKQPEFDGSTIIVKIEHQILKDIGSSPILDEFFKSYTKYHKIIIFGGISDKVYNVLSKKSNTEVFDKDSQMIDLMSLTFAPISCGFVQHDESLYIMNPKIEKIHENDPIVRYYNGKRGNILRIIRPSINNSAEVVYKRIIEAKSLFH